MRNRIGALCGACLSLLAFSTAALAQATLDDPRRLEAFMDGVVKPLMKEQHTTAGVVAIERQGEVVLLKGYGWQNLESRTPVDPATTLFRPGSVSKLFTWVAVMQLVERGALDLDADVNTYLRDFKIADTYPGQPITLRHCMTHTTGFEDSMLGYLFPPDLEHSTPLAQAMKRYQPARVRPPGEAPAYSNYCAALAGLIVANVSGVEFPEYVKQHIFDPLGMHRASFEEPLPAPLQPDIAVAYSWSAGKHRARPYELIGGFAPAGALAASAPDMLRFGQALLNGGAYEGARILTPQSVEQLLGQQFTLDQRLRGIGLGFLRFAHGTADVVGHDGGTTNFGTHFGLLRANDMVIYLSFGGPGWAKVYAGVTNALYAELFPRAPQVDVPPQDFGQRSGIYAGTYGSRRSNSSTLEKLLKLRSQTKVAPTADGALLIGEKRYVEIGKHLFRGAEDGDLIAFQVDDTTGKASGYVRDGMPVLSSYRLPTYATRQFNLSLLGFAAIVFAAVVLRFLYQRDRYNAASGAERTAMRAAVVAAVSNLCAVIVLAWALSITAQTLLSSIPTALKVALVLPIVATAAGTYLLYQLVVVWRRRLLDGWAARIRYGAVAVCAAVMSWLYFYWNILGYRYL